MIIPNHFAFVNLPETLGCKRPHVFSQIPSLFYDVETYKGYFCVAYVLENEAGEEVERGVLDTPEDIWDVFLPVLLGQSRLVGFNNWSFDDRVMHYVLSFINRNGRLPRSETIHELGNLIINGQNLSGEERAQRDARLAAFGVPIWGNYSLAGMSDDARLTLGSRTPSQKVLESRMGSVSIEETPIPFDQEVLSEEEKIQVGSYCLWDTRETRKIYKQVQDQCESFGLMAASLETEISTALGVHPLEVASVLEPLKNPTNARQGGIDWLGLYAMRSLPQSQFAERFVRIQAFLAEIRTTGFVNPFVVLPPTEEDVLHHPKTVAWSPDPSIPLAKHYGVRRWVREGLGSLKYALHARGMKNGEPQHHIGVTKADTADAILIEGTLYRVGVGGIHSVDPPGMIVPGEGQELVDLDVTSFYPQLVVNLEVAPIPWPQHLQREFLSTYKMLMEQRIAIKGKVKGEKDPVEKKRLDALAYAYKIVLNSVYGKFRDRFSVLWSPQSTPRVTLHGQLFLLHLIERAGELGAKVVSANTDGLTILGPVGVKDILVAESQGFGFGLEETPYSMIARESISCYAALKPSGEIKRKGAMETTLGLSAEVKRPIVYDAVVEFLLGGVPVETTVQKAVEARQWTRFCMMRKTTAKSPYTLVSASHPEYREEGKVFRFVWAKREWRDTDGRGGYKLTKATTAAAKYGDEWDVMPCRSLKSIDSSGIDTARYVSRAWEIIAKILPPSDQESFLPTVKVGTHSPKDLWNFGIYPSANRGKIVISGKRFSTIQPWGSATTLGCYTGPRFGRILVLDIDDPDALSGFLAYEKRKRKDSLTPFALSEPLCTMTSCKEGIDPEAVRLLKARGKLIFSVPDTQEFANVEVLTTLPPTAFSSKSRSKNGDLGAGVDIFYGGNLAAHPSLCGDREDGSQYVLSGEQVLPLPLWLWQRIEAHLLPADFQRVHDRGSVLTEELELLPEEEDEIQESTRYALDTPPSREEKGVEFAENYSEEVPLTHRGATWVTGILESAVKNAAASLLPNTPISTRSHYSIPTFSPHVLEIECFGKHGGSRSGKTVVAIVEDKESGESRVVYKCFGSSCQSSQGVWREEIQRQFDDLIEARRQKVLERLRDLDLPEAPEDPQEHREGPQEPPTAPLGPSGRAGVPSDFWADMDSSSLPEVPVVEPLGAQGTVVEKPSPKRTGGKKATLVPGINPVGLWNLGPHLVGAYHQPTGSGKGFGCAQSAIENLLRGKLTLYVAPRNAQLATFSQELKKHFAIHRKLLMEHIGDIMDLTRLRFVGLASLTDSQFAQELFDKLCLVVNADNHQGEISLGGQMVILTNPYYIGQKGDSGKAHPFSYQLSAHAIKLGIEGTILLDEYHDIVREAWTKSAPIRVRYHQRYSQARAGLTPSILSRCPAKPSGYSGRSSGDCSTCLSCEAPVSLRSFSGVLVRKELTVLNFGEGEHPFDEAEDAPLMELGETSSWKPITFGKTQVAASVSTMKLGANLRHDDAWHEGQVSRGWDMDARCWNEEKRVHRGENERRAFVYKRDKGALSYSLRANFGIRAIMDCPVKIETGEPILSEDELDEVLSSVGPHGVRFPLNACLSPTIQWIDATALYRLMSFVESGWKVRFLSATISPEALDHVKILADEVEARLELLPGETFSFRDEPASEAVRLGEVMLVATGLSIGTIMKTLSTRKATELLSVATDEGGVLVPNRIAAFFGRKSEARDFWNRNAERSDFHPWWGLHQENHLQVQNAIGESSKDLSHRAWMKGSQGGPQAPHIVSYLYGSLSTGANIENLRTLVCDYSVPPPLRTAVSCYEDQDEESLRESHAKSFANIITQVVGRVLRFRDRANRAVILVCGVESYAEFEELAAALPLDQRTGTVRYRYVANPTDVLPTLYGFLHRRHDVVEGITRDLTQVVAQPPMEFAPLSPEFPHPLEPRGSSITDSIGDQDGAIKKARGSAGAKLASLLAGVHVAVEDGESWHSYRSRGNVLGLHPDIQAQVKRVWDEVVGLGGVSTTSTVSVPVLDSS